MPFRPSCAVCVSDCDGNAFLSSCQHFLCSRCWTKYQTSQPPTTTSTTTCPRCQKQCKVVKLSASNFPSDVQGRIQMDTMSGGTIGVPFFQALEFQRKQEQMALQRLKELVQVLNNSNRTMAAQNSAHLRTIDQLGKENVALRLYAESFHKQPQHHQHHEDVRNNNNNGSHQSNSFLEDAPQQPLFQNSPSTNPMNTNRMPNSSHFPGEMFLQQPPHTPTNIRASPPAAAATPLNIHQQQQCTSTRMLIPLLSPQCPATPQSPYWQQVKPTTPNQAAWGQTCINPAALPSSSFHNQRHTSPDHQQARDLKKRIRDGSSDKATHPNNPQPPTVKSLSSLAHSLQHTNNTIHSHSQMQYGGTTLLPNPNHQNKVQQHPFQQLHIYEPTKTHPVLQQSLLLKDDGDERFRLATPAITIRNNVLATTAPPSSSHLVPSQQPPQLISLLS